MTWIALRNAIMIDREAQQNRSFNLLFARIGRVFRLSVIDHPGLSIFPVESLGLFDFRFQFFN